MVVIVLDANVSNRGHFDQRRLIRIAQQLAPSKPDLVIPEVVVLEWIEHAYANYEELRKLARSADPMVGVPSLPSISIAEFDRKVRGAIPKEYRIWEPAVAAWMDAVRDQVLQTGTGTTKAGVKTGAADHLVLACVSDHVSTSTTGTKVLLYSEDKLLRKACSVKCGDRVEFVSSERDLTDQLLVLRSSPREIERRVELAAQEILGNAAFEPIEECDVAIGDANHHQPGQVVFDEPFVPLVKTVQNVKNVESGDGKFGFATLWFTGSGEWSRGFVEGSESNFAGDYDSLITIIMPIVFELDSSQQVVNIERSGRPLVAFGGLGVALTASGSWSAGDLKGGKIESSLVARSQGGVLPDFDENDVIEHGSPELLPGTAMRLIRGDSLEQEG